MTMGFVVALRNDRANLIRDRIDAGGAAGTVELMDGTRPATGAAITTQEVVATGTFSYPCAANAANGVLTFSAITGGNAVKDATPTWARFKDSAGNIVSDASAGATGSGADVEVNPASLVTGKPVDFTAASITEGNA